ncbi:MAG: efflux RND transporter periplasmic adaptor subunit [Thiobacillus sp.]|nr:efflux RND transporter periplasmic adaptor subunit [Sulfurimicrobium sp.]MDP2198078.1 efflux RND transporter periplasmic adaptor subunit [Sulfurimicrobium sp.]MDP3685971.1 efflux RND transporter periplasmic adaptor subunit [Sulfurimicrobium sp.]MDZ7593750.1 efflux RND transporter periplasmic adaptor subunit [Thiobacillus sp.]
MKTSKRILLILVGTLLLGVLVWAFRPQPVLVELAEVSEGPFDQTIMEDGKTRVRERYVISAPLAGKMQRITLKAGDAVKAGDTLAVIAPSAPALLDARAERELGERVGSAEANRQRATAEAARAYAALDKSSADLERARKLAEKNFVSTAALEQATLAVKLNQRELEAAKYGEQAAKHEVAVARAALFRWREEASGKNVAGQRWEVHTPLAGKVLKVLQESESVVSIGTPLLEIGQPTELEVVVDVLSSDAVQIPSGAQVRFERWGKSEALEGVVRRVEPAAFTKVSALGVEEQRVNVIIDLTSPAERWQTLGDGYKVDARIITASLDKAVKVPVSALFRAGDQWAVFVAREGRAAKQIVTLSRRSATEAVVQEGLKVGEKVIVHPSDSVSDNKVIRERQK